MNKDIKTDYIAMTVFNRRETTLRCLYRLRELGVFEWATAVVVDDASSDGTAEVLRSAFSEQDVVVLDGSGDLWWGGGTRMAMEYAYKQDAETIFWLNDDCLIKEGVLEKLRDYALENKCIALAKAVTPGGKVYAGVNKNWRGLKTPVFDGRSDVQVDGINGNCVCLPRFVVDDAGLIDAKHFPHYRADSDYSLRAKQLGYASIVVGGVECENQDNTDLGAGEISWLLTDQSLIQLWKVMGTKKSSSYFPMHYSFYFRHWGVWGLVLATVPFVRFWIIFIIRLCIPRNVLRKLWGARSSGYQIESNAGKRTNV
jgi:glycosyltransferase involved in cell wall biosynthesis